MIDHRLRNERILVEAADPETAVILLDIVLGTGSHPDPAADLAPIIEQVQAGADPAPAFVGFVCGTDRDPQNLGRQEARLAEAGMTLTSSNAEAVRLAIQIATEGRS
jgi:FdrA protein